MVDEHQKYTISVQILDMSKTVLKIVLAGCSTMLWTSAHACTVARAQTSNLMTTLPNDLAVLLAKKPNPLVLDIEVTSVQPIDGWKAFLTARVRSVLLGHFSGRDITIEHSRPTSCDRTPTVGESGIIGGWMVSNKSSGVRLVTPNLGDWIGE